MIKAAIEKILSLGGSKAEVIADRFYQNGPTGIMPLVPPKAETLIINTLTGIIDYGITTSVKMIHIFDHKTVMVIEKDYHDDWLTRSTYLKAVHESPVYQFGAFMNVESFIINLQAMFVQDENTDKLFRVVGNIKEEAVMNFSDDGITQGVTAKSGISTVSLVQVPNPVTLRPYRTFMEIEQPASTFVFRMRGEKGAPPSCGLFEADGRMWRLQAISSIKFWLEQRLPGVKIIA
jgi:hypothetical protein